MLFIVLKTTPVIPSEIVPPLEVQYVVQAAPRTVVIITSSVETVQPPLVIDHRNVADAPTANPVIPDVEDEGVVIVAVPEITDHVPVPTIGVFPANVAVVAQAASVWSEPALAVVGGVTQGTAQVTII